MGSLGLIELLALLVAACVVVAAVVGIVLLVQRAVRRD